jgi:thymidylate kinase
MQERPYYIHFDGMDLAGKTTATQNFIKSTNLEWEFRRNSLSGNNPIHLLADSLRKVEAYDAEVLGNLYVAALMADIRSFKWPDQNTIQDSTIILRSIAFHTVRGTPRIREVLLDLLPEHPRFDASFVFTASIEERVKRLQKRMDVSPQEVSEEDLMVIKKPEKFLAMEACLVDTAKMAFHSVIIDTSSLSADMVVGEIHKNFQIQK